jgi:Alpha-2,8-polysialyltransferase (POLYST)
MTAQHRIIAVQGPGQLLNVLAILFEEQESNPGQTYNDILVIHGMCVPPPRDQFILNATLEVAKIWNWKGLCNLTEFENACDRGEYQTATELVQAAKVLIGIDHADVMYAVRNWQLTNEILLTAYVNARKIVYGDIGCLMDAVAGPNHVQFDEARLLIPAQSLLSLNGERTVLLGKELPYTTFNPSYIIKAIRRYLDLSPSLREYLSALQEFVGNNGVLILLSNYTEAKYLTHEDEISMYVTKVTEYALPGDTVLIKPHPRETLNTSELVKQRLIAQYGMRVHVIGETGTNRALPVEIVCHTVAFKKILSTNASGSLVWLKLLYGIVYNDEIVFWNKIIGDAAYRKSRRDHLRFMDEIMRRLPTWQGEPIIYSPREQKPGAPLPDERHDNQRTDSPEDAQLREIIQWLDSQQTPLDGCTQEGSVALSAMLSSLGEQIRSVLPQYRPVCTSFPFGISILSDGTVTTCCLDPLGENAFGSIYADNIIGIWKRILPKVLENGLYNLKRCRSCVGSKMAPLTSTEGERNNWLSWPTRYPQEITIEIMGTCNYGCCVSKDLHRIRTVKPDLDAIFHKIRPYLSKVKRLRLFNYGEPLLHDGFKRFLSDCRNASDRLVLSLASNGLLMDEEYARNFIENRIDNIVVSVHGGPGTENMLKYSKYGAEYDRVLANVKRLMEMRKIMGSEYPKISLRVILFDWNDTDVEMDRFRDDAKKLGLTATGGNPDSDNYHWILDGGSGGGPISSKRFVPGSPELLGLKQSKELMS